MEISKDSYVLGIWFINQEDIGNILMTVVKDNEKATKWYGEIRVRTYLDNKNFGSKDRKTTSYIL